jgi:hypothetical protein
MRGRLLLVAALIAAAMPAVAPGEAAATARNNAAVNASSRAGPPAVGTPPANAMSIRAAEPDSFWRTFSAPLWVVLLLNVATLIAAGTGAWAALRTNPKTALRVAETQAGVARDAVAASMASAEAAREAAAAASLNAQVAARAASDQGIHAIARLRQEWINELRARVAQAHALLSNRPVEPDATNPQAVQADLE